MSETDNLQAILDYYRTRCYQTEYEYLVFQQSAKEKITELESSIRELTGSEAVEELTETNEQSK